MTVRPPLAGGREPPVDHEDAQDLFPLRVLVADGPAGAEKSVEVERAPELVGEPAGAPLSALFVA